MLVLTVVLMISSAAASSSNTSYCSHNTLVSNTSWPRFTKEPVPFEYGFEDKFKSIHCCAGGYRNIDWFKNDVPHPWSAGVSSFIQYPESAYQTLYTRRLQRSDAGNYTCRISNETHSEQHTILLEVLEKPPDAPKTMFISKDQWVGEGSRVRLYCEALVGRSYLADARSDLSWWKKYPNGTEGVLLASQSEIKTKRDDVDEIIGAYLTFPSVTAADYGTYVCAVRSNGVIYRNTVTLHYQSWLHETSSSVRCEGECVPWRGLAIGFGVAIVLLASLIVLHRRCTPRLLLAARIVHHRATNTQEYRARVMEKEFDVLVCWTEVDGDLVRGALLPTLSIKYKYRVYGVQLPTNPDTWYETLSPHAPRGRSLVCVLSPTQHSGVQLLAALRHLHALPTPPVVLLLQDIPRLKPSCKDSNGDSVVSLLRRTRLLAWRHVHERAFWTALRLALPLPLPPNHLPHRKDEPIEIEDNKNSRSGSLTALV